MRIDDVLNIADAQTAMCNLSVLIAKKASKPDLKLSNVEQVISDIMWIDIQVSANGFDGWLYYTSCERMVRTVKALIAAGCSGVVDIVNDALAVVKFDPQHISDTARQALLDSLSVGQRGKLSQLDSKYYDASDECARLCKEFVIARRGEFELNEATF